MARKNIYPWDELKDLTLNMERLMRDFWMNQREKLSSGLSIKEAAVDVVDSGNAIEVAADLPGVDKKDIVLNIEEDRMEIRAQKKLDRIEKKKDYYRRERSQAGFYKAFSLPARVDPAKASTEFKNGILSISLPKIGAKEKRKRIIKL